MEDGIKNLVLALFWDKGSNFEIWDQGLKEGSQVKNASRVNDLALYHDNINNNNNNIFGSYRMHNLE